MNTTGTEIYTKKAVKNAKGVWFAPGKDLKTDLYIIFQRCANYNGQVRGGLSYTWRVVASDLSLEDAKAYLNKKAGEIVYG